MLGRSPELDAKSRWVVITAFDGVTLSDISGPADIFGLANSYFLDPDQPRYKVIVASVGGGSITTSSGMVIETQDLHSLDPLSIDTLIVAGGGPPEAPPTPAPLVAWLRDHGRKVRRFCAVCTGVFLLAEAGLLQGYRVTTHWLAASRLASRYPNLIVDPQPIFIKDKDAWSSAGFTAGLDLSLAILEEDCGYQVAVRASQVLVMFLRRPGEQPQISAPLVSQAASDAGFARLHGWMMQNLRQDLRIEVLAERAGMSLRTFSRRYMDVVGRTPAKSVELFRVEAAQRELARGNASLKAVARNCGFGSVQNLRRAFVRSLSMMPDDYRGKTGDFETRNAIGAFLLEQENPDCGSIAGSVGRVLQ